MASSNMYAILEDSVAAPDASAPLLTPPASDDENEEQFHHIQFDLAQLESTLGVQGLFTRELLRKIQKQRLSIIVEMKKPSHLRAIAELPHTTCGGTYKVFNSDEDSEPADEYDCVTVRFMSRIELHPDFQRKLSGKSNTSRQLRMINERQGSIDWLPVPYTLALDKMAYSEEHLDKGILQGYWDALTHTRDLWMESNSRIRLLQAINSLAKQQTSINKIVCIGLGAIDLGKAWYQSSLQHMTAFTVAKQLEKYYRKPVQIMLQDPCYTEKDRVMLKGLYGKGCLSFVSDPDGLLAIDSKTIVITAFLPVGYPLMQIIADMFSGTKGEGPAAIICDSMELDPSREFYSLTDRSSPEVARFLTTQYEVQDFKDHRLEEELAKDQYVEEVRYYWLSQMQLYTRK
jgi:hypothetical protein